MKKQQRISSSEMQIMEYIWKINRPITTAEIMNNLPDSVKWSQNTVITFLGRLTEKGIIKSTRVGRAFHYEAIVSKHEYQKTETRQFIDDIHKGSILGFISSLCDDGEITKKDIEELMKRLKE